MLITLDSHDRIFSNDVSQTVGVKVKLVAGDDKRTQKSSDNCARDIDLLMFAMLIREQERLGQLNLVVCCRFHHNSYTTRGRKIIEFLEFLGIRLISNYCDSHYKDKISKPIQNFTFLYLFFTFTLH